MKIVSYDMRGGSPSTSKVADLYIVPSTMTQRPVLGNPSGRVLVSLSGTVHYTPTGVVDPHPLNLAMFDIAVKFGALMPGVLGFEENGYYTQGIDLTKRNVPQAMLPLWLDTFKWADGLHWDSYTPLNDAPGWDGVMAGMATHLRTNGKLVCGQQHQLTPAVMGTNGPWWEDLTGWGYTLARHAEDAKKFRDAAVKYDGRETIFVAEVRNPASFPQWYLDQVKAWVEANDFYLSVGVDQSAGGSL